MQRTCAIEGCEKPTRSNSAEWCKMHYHRWYRHGSTDVTAQATPITVSLGRRYRVVAAKGHPVAMASGRAYEHRVVLYDHIGPGPHPCHWCGTQVDWLPKGAAGELQPDHLDNDGGNNDPANLVASCRPCNTARGSQRRTEALRAAGWWSEHDTIAHLSRGGRTDRVEERRSA